MSISSGQSTEELFLPSPVQYQIGSDANNVTDFDKSVGYPVDESRFWKIFEIVEVNRNVKEDMRMVWVLFENRVTRLHHFSDLSCILNQNGIKISAAEMEWWCEKSEIAGPNFNRLTYQTSWKLGNKVIVPTKFLVDIDEEMQIKYGVGLPKETLFVEGNWTAFTGPDPAGIKILMDSLGLLQFSHQNVMEYICNVHKIAVQTHQNAIRYGESQTKLPVYVGSFGKLEEYSRSYQGKLYLPSLISGYTLSNRLRVPRLGLFTASPAVYTPLGLVLSGDSVDRHILPSAAGGSGVYGDSILHIYGDSTLDLTKYEWQSKARFLELKLAEVLKQNERLRKENLELRHQHQKRVLARGMRTEDEYTWLTEKALLALAIQNASKVKRLSQLAALILEDEGYTKQVIRTHVHEIYCRLKRLLGRDDNMAIWGRKDLYQAAIKQKLSTEHADALLEIAQNEHYEREMCILSDSD